MLAIETNNLTKYYGKSPGMLNVNLSINKGEVFGFIGPNGAGKSTTIRTLLGLLVPTSGTGKIMGMDIVEDGHKIRQKIGYLPSEVNYYEEMSSLELLEYSARFYPNTDKSKIAELADYFELDLKKPITDLSFGNKKKCAIIESVLHDPEILILDEPTSGLDPLMQNRFFDLLREKNKNGTTIFFSSHVLSEIQRLCHRAAVIRKGEITAVEDIQTLLEKQMKRVRLVLKEGLTSINFPEGVQNEKIQDNKIMFEYVGKIKDLISWIQKLDVIDVVMEEPDLESIFMNYYER
ncbi:ABC transporter ATP-binding protein [Paracrocinitomix mangrovi]|uniref:ABC transporter ATP-binding protein n=1 Tax=Paracrocinitomix mangrovi TaxID=2862509 RepID=UPI001C8D4FD3|nr:ABC transporter ATP-binding protein [Paracrocinitomix mangrovi]UKN01721.1 ABC transporter ATP-binding protein [Paracrocinitomix mangrovi]